jgi:ATP-dependent HslUV protease ATP-binding subunit HslU
LADAPFIVEATKYTEVGAWARMDGPPRSEIAIKQTRETAKRQQRKRYEDAAEERILTGTSRRPKCRFGAGVEVVATAKTRARRSKTARRPAG